MPDPFETIFKQVYGTEQQALVPGQTDSGWRSLVRGSDPTDEVARRFGQLVERLTDTEASKLRRPEDTDTQWDRLRQSPVIRESARRKLFADTPVEAWDVQRTRIRGQVLQEQMRQAKLARIGEIEPAITSRLKEAGTDEANLELTTIREVNKILYAEGFGVVPAFKPGEFKRGLLGEARAGFVRGSLRIAEDTRTFYSDLLGQAAEKLDLPDVAQQFYASGEGARRRGEAEARAFRPSEDIGEFDPSNPRWWAARVGENVPQFGLMMGGGMAAGAVARALGMGAKAVSTFQTVVASGGIGSIEAASAYESSLEQLVGMGIPIGEARGLASEQALVVGAVNALLESVAIGEFLTKIPGGRGRLIRAVRGAVIEGATEGLQETTAIMGEAYAKAKASGGTTARALAEMGRPVPDEISRILASFAIGGLMGAGMGGVSPTARDTAPQAGRTLDPAVEAAPLEGMVQAERATTEAAPRVPVPYKTEDQTAPPTSEGTVVEAGRVPAETVPARTLTGDAMVEAPPVTPEPPGKAETVPFKRQPAEAPVEKAPEGVGRTVLPDEHMSTNDVIARIGEMEGSPEILRTMIGEGPFAEVRVPIATVDPGILTPDAVDETKLAAAREALAAGTAAPPIVAVPLGEGLTVADGVHRFLVAKEAGQETIAAIAPVSYIEAAAPAPAEVPTAAPAAAVTPIAAPAAVEAPTGMELEAAILEGEAPAPTEFVSIHGTIDASMPVGSDPLDGPSTISIPDEDTSTVAAALGDEVRRLLRDESGGWDVQVTGRLIAGGIRTTADEAGIIHTGLAALTDETTVLRQTRPGVLAVQIVDSAISRSDAMIGRLTMAFHTVWKNLSRGSKRWLNAIREDGQTNYVTLIEHPDRITEIIPDDIRAVLAVHSAMMQETGNEAERVGIPQQKRDGTVGPFKKANAGRFIRFQSPDFAEALELQSGPTYDALINWLVEHPERNPHLPTDAIELRERLRGDRKSGATKKLGSLEYTRTFKELPVTLMVEGKQVPVQEARPWHHFRAAVVSQSRLIYFHGEVQDRLLPRYGTFNEETGKTELPHKMNPELTDMDGLWDSLRYDTVRAAKRPKTAQKAFNRLSENYYRHHYGGYADQLLPLRYHSRLIRGLAIVYRDVQASLIILSGIYDLFQPWKGLHRVGARNILRGYVDTTIDVVFNKKERLAEYKAIGAVRDGYTDWGIRPSQPVTDLMGKAVPQAIMWLPERAEVASQSISARATELWIDEVNRAEGLENRDANLLREDFRLTDDEVLQVARGEMTPATKTKIIQNGVKTVNYLREDPHRRGLLRNKPLLRWLVPFTSMLNGTTRETGRIMTHIVDDVKGVKQNRDAAAWKRLLQSSTALIKFVAVCAGVGFAQKYLRRLVTGKPIIDPEDPEEWYKSVFEALGEGAIFGPYYRILEAGKYSGGDPYRYAINLAPALSIILEAATAFTATGKYENSPWADRLERAGLRFSPAGRAFRSWYDKFVWPERGEYNRIRSLVRKFNRDRGKETRYGTGPRNYSYYRIFEAVRDNNEEAAEQAIAMFKQESKEQGVGSKLARTGLRSSLQSRRPINLKPEAAREFLGTLSEEDKLLAEQVQQRYAKLIDKYTGGAVPLGPPGPPRPPRPSMEVDWYGAQ